MSKLPIAGGSKFVPHAEPKERIPVNVIPTAKEVPAPKWTPNTDKPHYEQKSESGNDEGHSGLPLKSDGKLRGSSDFNHPSQPFC